MSSALGALQFLRNAEFISFPCRLNLAERMRDERGRMDRERRGREGGDRPRTVKRLSARSIFARFDCDMKRRRQGEFCRRHISVEFWFCLLFNFCLVVVVVVTGNVGNLARKFENRINFRTEKIITALEFSSGLVPFRGRRVSRKFNSQLFEPREIRRKDSEVFKFFSEIQFPESLKLCVTVEAYLLARYYTDIPVFGSQIVNT